MKLYILVLTRGKRTVTMAVYDEDEEAAKITAIEIYTGWDIISTHLKENKTRIIIHAKFNEDIGKNFCTSMAQ